MPAIVRPPTERKVMLNLSTEDDPDQEAFIVARPATTREEARRSEIGSEVSRTFHDDNKAVEVKYKWTYAAQQRLEVYLVLSGCNIEVQDPENAEKTYPIFKFQRRADGKMALSMSEAEFEIAWGILPKEWSDEIHLAILKVNPTWQPGFRSDKDS